ncbi:DUF2971 domain-containing protein [Pedobacter sp. SYSU D00535]|uniref:DUF2971 domain-containing protein n=1 Tax=Pedobacter sp. SYSU D00535 TaxID=2810308 RepID=UPI001A969A19|nr:DUF2971 domain-containing protein [Pedobacter sp. SYSU D00535]
MILYKYRNNSEFTDKIFSEKKVWLSNAAGLNDPFECTIGEIAKEWIDEELKKLKEGHIMGFVHGAALSIKSKTNFYDLNPRQTEEFLNKFRQKDFDAQYKTTREFILRKTGREISNPEETFANFDKQLNDVGIFSLSESDDSELMWAHYADSSKGIAIGFEVTEGGKLANAENCLKVTYSDVRPTFGGTGFKTTLSFYAFGKNIQKISFDDTTFQQAVSTKTTNWSYEREWRYIEERSGSYDFPGKLKEVIFGLKCPIDQRRKYIDLVSTHFDYPIEFYEVIIFPNSNKFTKRRYEFTE